MQDPGTNKKRFLLPLGMFLMLHAGTHLSLFFQQGYATSDFFLPSALSVVFIFWFGPRMVLPIVYLNSVASSYFWGHPLSEWPQWFVYGLAEPVYPALAWFLIEKVFKARYWLPDLRNTLIMLIAGVLFPTIVQSILLQGMLVGFGKLGTERFWPSVTSNLLSEFANTFFLTFPLLYHLSPTIAAKRISATRTLEDIRPVLTPARIIETLITFAAIVVAILCLDFKAYWYLYGLISFYVGIRLGFGAVIVANLLMIIVTYIVPRFFTGSWVPAEHELSQFFFTANSMFVFAALNARVISDLRIAETELKNQNRKLDRANQELDKFIYSVSHELSAPLKSILGLVGISKFTASNEELRTYIGLIGTCVNRLEDYISQTFDYSRASRMGLNREAFNLKELCTELIEKIKGTDEGSKIDFQLSVHNAIVYQDRQRLTMILNNLLSNAVRYQDSSAAPGNVHIKSYTENDDLIITVQDNGEGIPKEEFERIFTMFYRGSEKSTGQGLGLYIARESARALGGDITVDSQPGLGSTFIVKIPKE